MRLFFTAALLVVNFSPRLANAGTCALEFANLEIELPRFSISGQVPSEKAIDFLADLETRVQNLASELKVHVANSGLSGSPRSSIQSQLDSETQQLQARVGALIDKTLEDGSQTVGHEFEMATENLRRTAMSLRRNTLIAIRREQGAAFSEIAENPELISSRHTYNVPVPDSISGASAAGRLTVRFSSEVIDELVKAPHESHRFMRSLIKGYVGSHAGDGILRITDQHEDLVEIKFVSKGAHRLIGCRRPGGLIEILKYYEKRNEGAGGSLKRYAKLCD